jgi:hypothetical protein
MEQNLFSKLYGIKRRRVNLRTNLGTDIEPITASVIMLNVAMQLNWYLASVRASYGEISTSGLGTNACHLGSLLEERTLDPML